MQTRFKQGTIYELEKEFRQLVENLSSKIEELKEKVKILEEKDGN